MRRTGAQKFLLAISVINIVLGILSVIYGAMTLAGGGSSGGLSTESLMASGANAVEAEQVVTTFNILVILAIVSGVISLIQGVLGIRAANDNQKIMPVWFISLISLAFSISNVFTALFQGNFGIATVVSLVVPSLVFWAANTIKAEAGK